MAITFVMTGSRFAIGGVSLGGLLVKQRFGMSARKGKNGFVRERIVSSPGLRRNIQDGNESVFNERKIGGMEIADAGTNLVRVDSTSSCQGFSAFAKAFGGAASNAIEASAQTGAGARMSATCTHLDEFQHTSTILPVVPRPSSARCASAARSIG
jgi:hypothetical protein